MHMNYPLFRIPYYFLRALPSLFNLIQLSSRHFFGRHGQECPRSLLVILRLWATFLLIYTPSTKVTFSHLWAVALHCTPNLVPATPTLSKRWAQPRWYGAGCSHFCNTHIKSNVQLGGIFKVTGGGRWRLGAPQQHHQPSAEQKERKERRDVTCQHGLETSSAEQLSWTVPAWRVR
jgi:hypothetical protein